MSIIVPAIKSQGIKTKLVPWINDIILQSGLDLPNTNWIEPFFGTGVVGLNTIVGGKRLVGDTNPHIINFYQGLQNGDITPCNMRCYLNKEGEMLANADEDGYVHFTEVKKRFNSAHSSFDFIFLSRAGFNGMMRFNRKGEWNIPFCKKPDRFAPAYVTKICNQVQETKKILNRYKWEFRNQDFLRTIESAQKGDLIYCDPPYFGRYVDYYNGWTAQDEENLYNALSQTSAHFILSTWHHNEFRSNDMIGKFWGHFNIETQEHFYHSGGHIENRHAMVEALVFNFDLQKSTYIPKQQQMQMEFQFL